MESMFNKYVIIGAGPTGLGAAHRLAELGCKDFLVLEKESHAGGLSASFKDDQGFTWDVGGHVLFSHYEYFDRLVDKVLEGQYYRHERKAFIRIANTWVPYPFQNNLRYLPPELRWQCLSGLLDLEPTTNDPENFHEWIVSTFGQGIAESFMIPYNEKVWATPLQMMDWHWIGERVSVVDLRRAVRNVALEEDDVSWGPNNTFLFPREGGTGAIFSRLAQGYSDHIFYRTEVERIDTERKIVQTKDARSFSYGMLLNTAPVDILILQMIQNAPKEIRQAAKSLRHNSVHVVGIGVEEEPDSSMCWMYFPEPQFPFYRVTNFHNYSASHVPRKGKQKALMAEKSFCDSTSREIGPLLEETEEGLISAGLFREAGKTVSRWHKTAEYAYPVPTNGRDAALRRIHSWLVEKGIYSRGRFGGWKYEVGNMDHSVMQGVEWADFIVCGKKETTYVA